MDDSTAYIAGLTSPSLFANTPAVDSLAPLLDRHAPELVAQRRDRLAQISTVGKMVVR